jgi:hypothetical protein
MSYSMSSIRRPILARWGLFSLTTVVNSVYVTKFNSFEMRLESCQSKVCYLEKKAYEPILIDQQYSGLRTCLVSDPDKEVFPTSGFSTPICTTHVVVSLYVVFPGILFSWASTI